VSQDLRVHKSVGHIGAHAAHLTPAARSEAQTAQEDDLRAIVRGVLNLQENIDTTTAVRLDDRLGDMPATVRVGRMRIEQCVSELFSTLTTASVGGTPSRASTAWPAAAACSVADNGRGKKPAVREHLFEPRTVRASGWGSPS
jgi:C4-dicarboxylate-specific signal transduction histidine kinase